MALLGQFRGCNQAVAVAIEPSLVETKPMYLQVDLEGYHSYGRTIADLRHRSNKKPNVKVCIDVNSNKFKELFLKHVTGHIESMEGKR